MSLVNILVENLSPEIVESDLEKTFGPFGNVSSISIIKEKNKKFAYIVMSKQEDADAAIKSLNGKDLKGLKIIVKEARVY
ncbi:MAG: RNA-binding protein [Spirochaetota bacterium]|nr:RNA-binding protein [Spirochaetota bacterium]